MIKRDVKQFNNRILWIINFIVDKLIWIIPKNKKIWIFGAWLGNKYSDNSKYMFEYICNNKKDIKAFWITKNIDLYNSMSKDSKKIIYYKSLKGIWYRLIAGVVFYTNSLYDLGEVLIHSKSYKVALWHGMPLKKIYKDENAYLLKLENKNFRLMSTIKYKLFSDVKRNLSIASSDFTAQMLSSAFDINLKDIAITGQPRNDAFMKKKSVKFHNKYDNKNIILYMPTYRSKSELSNKYDILLKDLFENKDLSNLLEETNSIILIKTHYLVSKGNLISKNMFFIEDNEVEDVQELLAEADMLITDYSSCFIDYSISRKPIIFLANDIEEYEKRENGFYCNYYELTKGLLTQDSIQLTSMLKDIFKNPIKYKNLVNSINDLYNSNTVGNLYSENVYNEIMKRL